MSSTDRNGKTYTIPVDMLTWRPAAYGIVIKNSTVLLLESNDEFHLPGGGVELGETPDNAVTREIKEETGITITRPRLVDTLSTFFTYHDGHTSTVRHVQSLLLYYTCTITNDSLSTDGQDEEEKRENVQPVWIPLGHLGSITVGTTADWRQVINSPSLAAKQSI